MTCQIGAVPPLELGRHGGRGYSSHRHSRLTRSGGTSRQGDLSDPDMISEVEKLVRQGVRAKPRWSEHDRKRIEQLRREVQNLTDAIAQGMLRTSGAIGQRLVAAETELQRLEIASMPAKALQLVPKVRERLGGCRAAWSRSSFRSTERGRRPPIAAQHMSPSRNA